MIPGVLLFFVLCTIALPTTAADEPPSPPQAAFAAAGIVATPLLSELLSTAPGKRLSLVQLDVAPGSTAAPHRHAGYLFVYVVAGEVVSQITGDAVPVHYVAGQSFVERPGVEHTHFENPSRTEPARVLIVWFAEDGATMTTPAAG